MKEDGPTRKELTRALIWWSLTTAIFVGYALWIFGESILPLFRGEQVLYWQKWGPLVIIGTLGLVLYSVRFILLNVRVRDSEYSGPLLAPTFRHDEHIALGLIFLGILAPFIAQPIIDYIVTPSLGYEYCETLTERQSTFGFQTYAYVKDAALCVASHDAN